MVDALYETNGSDSLKMILPSSTLRLTLLKYFLSSFSPSSKLNLSESPLLLNPELGANFSHNSFSSFIVFFELVVI
ncbi:hypothetical protein CNEONATNEC26_02218 [Clostridium neonatale]|nr:hypothetical protein CNEONATNEC26_02218 [Clostridium neonatale]